MMRVRITRLREERPPSAARAAPPPRQSSSPVRVIPVSKYAAPKPQLEPRPRLKTPYQPTVGDVVFLAGKRHILGKVTTAGPQQSEVKWANGNISVVVNYWIVKTEEQASPVG